MIILISTVSIKKVLIGLPSPDQGLGGRIIDAYMIFNTKEIFSIIIIIGMLGYLGNKILDILERKIIHWKGYYNIYITYINS